MNRTLVKGIIAAWLATVTGCGVFDPRDAEFPDGKPTVNNVNLQDILQNGTTERFTNEAYEDIFHPDFEYVSAYDLDTRYGKASMVNHLRLMEANHGSSLRVLWAPDTVRQIPADLNQADTTSLYRVYSVLTEQDTLYGDALFQVVYERVKGSWSILRWKDAPRSPPGIFNPSGR